MADTSAPIEPDDPTIRREPIWEAGSTITFFRALDADETPPEPDPEPFGFNRRTLDE